MAKPRGHEPILSASRWSVWVRVSVTLFIAITYSVGTTSRVNPSQSLDPIAHNEAEFTEGAAGGALAGEEAMPAGDDYPAAREVLNELLRDPVLRNLHLPSHWQFVILGSASCNAFALPDGRIVVDRRLATLLGQSRGLWAALLSHEIAHVSLGHLSRRSAFMAHTQQRLQDFSIATYGLGSRWQAAAFQAQEDSPETIARFSRKLELDADSDGMMLMARTGFHPDFEIALHHLMQAQVPSDSDTTLSSHPTWIARERSDQQLYAKALDQFTRAWPMAALSPGGAPPPLIFLEKPKLASTTEGHSTVTLGWRCANPGKPLRAVLRLFEKAGQQRAVNETIEYWMPVMCSELNGSKVFSIPPLEGIDPELKGDIAILDSDDAVLARSRPFTIRFRKTEKRSAR